MLGDRIGNEEKIGPMTPPVRLIRAGMTFISRWLPSFIIGFGIVLRTGQYLFNRSLWLDEAMLSLNIVHRPFLGLLQPLDYDQAAPFGFTAVEKLFVLILGNYDYSLRVVPLLCGILSLFLFYFIAKEYVGRPVALIALGLFAVLDPLVYYSSEVKPYSTDITIALLLYWVSIRTGRNAWRPLWVVLFGAVGAVAVWFSYPAVFVLAGIGVTLGLGSWRRRDNSALIKLAAICLMWALSFGFYYLISLHDLGDNQALLSDWSSHFAPFPPFSLSDVRWYPNAFMDLFTDPLDIPLPAVGAFALLVGLSAKFMEDREKSLILISPLIVALVASAFHKYPFSGRLLMFGVPLLLLFVAEGVSQIRGATKDKSLVFVAVLLGLLTVPPFYAAGVHLIKPRTAEEIKPVLDYIRNHQESQDIVYVYYSSKYAFQYYSESLGYNENAVFGVKSRDDPTNYYKDLDGLRGHPRVWVLFSHDYNWNGGDEQQLFLDHLNTIGKQSDSFTSAGAATYLYDLANESVK